VGTFVTKPGGRLNPLVEVWLIVARELRKNLRSVKGLVMLGLSVLGAIASLGAMASLIRQPKLEEALKRAEGMGTDALHDVKVEVLGGMYRDVKVGERLADAPSRLVFFFFVAIWLTPLLVAIVGFDGISSDLQYRSVRYWTIRTRRASYYVGKYLGLWAAVAIMTFVMHAIIWGVMIVRADASATEVLSWGVRFWLTSLPITGAWCAIATLIGSFFKTPMVGLLITCGTFFVMFFVGFIIPNWMASVEDMSTKGTAVVEHASNAVIALRFLYPNTLDAWLMSPELQHVLGGLGVFLGYALATCAGGSLVFARRDV
jgi:ABC-type transport system involved in multi-copper enzyme maturation permease subunit